MAIIKPGHEEEVGSAREDADKEGVRRRGGRSGTGRVTVSSLFGVYTPGATSNWPGEEMQATSSK